MNMRKTVLGKYKSDEVNYRLYIKGDHVRVIVIDSQEKSRVRFWKDGSSIIF